MKRVGAFGGWLALAACVAASPADAAPKPFVFAGPTVTNVAGRDGWRETAMTDIVVRAGSALDLSSLVGGAHAGAFGRARPAADGSLRFERRPKDKARFYGCVEGNISFNRIFDGCKSRQERHAAIDAFAEQTRRQGFNFVRPHGILDSGFDIRSYKGSGTISPEAMDNFDYFAAACRRRGIYIYVDLAAYRLRDPIDRNQLWRKAGVMVKDPEYWVVWTNCAAAVLNHVNPYTGLAWKDDPAVMGLMEYNEQATGAKIALQGGWKGLPAKLKAAYADGFNAWLAENEPGAASGGIDAASPALPSFYGKDPRGHLLHRYLSGLFAERALDYNSFVRALGCDALLTAYNSDVDLGACAARWRASDAVPYNFHFGHPHGGGQAYAGAVVSQRDSIANTAAGSDFCYGNRIRLADRPFIVTEYSHAFWNRHRYLAAALLPSYAAFNGYSGILWHEGGGDPKAVGAWPRGRIGVFRVSSSPAMRAASFLGAMLFGRGDVAESQKSVAVAVDNEYLKAHTRDAPSTSQARIGLMVKSGLLFPELPRPDSVKAPVKADVVITPGSGDEIEDGLWVSKVRGKESRDFNLDAFAANLKAKGFLPAGNRSSPKDAVYESATGELLLDGRAQTLAVVTPRTEAVANPAGRPRALGVFSLDESAEDCCAALTSVDGLPLAKSRRMVFLWITRESNSGMVTSADGKTMVRMGWHPALLKGGRVAFRARVADPERFRMYLLDYSGARLEEVPVRVENGELECALDTSSLSHGPTPFFELVADAAGVTYRFSANDGDVIGRVNALDLKPGDKVLFRRGDLFRGAIQGRSGVTYGAWGSGPRPTICASRRNYADPSLWRRTDETNVWRCTERLHNVGIVLFDHDPQVLGAFDRRFALMRLPKRNEPFDKPVQLDADLTFRNVFHDDRLELRSDHGNPGVRFSRIEIGEHGHCLWLKGDGIAVEDLHLTLSGSHGVGGSGMRRDITVRNCVIDWLGGSIIEGWKFGTARFGNGVEIWGGCDGFRVEGNWIYQIYDTGATIQCNDRNDFVCRMADVEFVSNRIENCFWALEYYNARNAAGSSVDNVRFAHNVCLRTGRGWGCVGRESQAPVLAIGVTPPSTTRFAVEKNVFDGSTGPLIACSEDAPQGAFSLRGNIYRQHEGSVLERMRYRLPPSSLSADPSSEEYRRQFSDKMFSSDAAAYLAQRYGDAAGRVETLGIRRGDRVVILGDSLTNQGLAVRDGGYWHRLTNGIARVHGDGYATVIPLGFSGWQLPAWIDTERKTRSKGLRHDTCGKFWDVKDVFDGGADIVAVFIGMNDILRPVVSADAASLDAWIARYRSFIATLRSRLKARRVLLATISPLTCDPQARKNEVRRELNARIRALAFEAGCGVIEIDRVLDPLNDEARRLWKSHLAGDFVHPSWGLGHAGIAQAFAEALGEWEVSAAFAEDVRREAERVLARADALSVNQTPLIASFDPDASEFEYEISWHLKRGLGGGKAAIELPPGWRVVSTNAVSAVPNAFEPRFFDGERGYFVVRGAPLRIATPVSVAVRTSKGAVLRKTVHIPAPWRARDNGGEWRLLSPSWDYCGWGSPWNVEPFQSFFGGTNGTLVACRRIWSPKARKAQVRLSTRAFSARLDVKARLNGALVGERSLRSSKEKCRGAPIDVELRKGWNALEAECRHDRSQRQFLCELAGVGGDGLDDLRYDWRLGE